MGDDRIRMSDDPSGVDHHAENLETFGGDKLRQEADGLFHRLWTKAVGSSTYNKSEWTRLESLVSALSSQSRCGRYQ